MVSDHSPSSMVQRTIDFISKWLSIPLLSGEEERFDLLFGIQMRKEPQPACFTFNLLFFLFRIPRFINSRGLRALGGAVGVRTGSPDRVGISDCKVSI